jgi:short-subunit dehydrogenase
VASTAALQPIPYFAVYAAAKAFVLSFTEALAGELRGTGVRVQALCPGVTRTEFLDVAGTHSVPVSRMPALSAEQVVEASLRGLDRGRVRVVVGWATRLLALVERFFPGVVVRAVAGELHRPRLRRP